MELVRSHFRPEFLNRIDEIVTFSHLEQSQLKAIIGLHVARLNKLLKDKGLELSLSPETVEWLSRIGYDRDYGARPMKRAFQREVQNPLSIELLEGKFPPGSHINASLDKEKVVFRLE